MLTEAAQSAFKQTVIDLLFNLNHVTVTVVKVSSSFSSYNYMTHVNDATTTTATKKRTLRGHKSAHAVNNGMEAAAALAPLPIVSLVYVIQFGYTSANPYSLYSQATSLITSSVNSGTFTSLLVINAKIYRASGLTGGKSNIAPNYTPLALTVPYSFPTFSPSFRPSNTISPSAAPQTNTTNSGNKSSITAAIIVVAVVAGVVILALVFLLVQFDRRRRRDMNRWNDALKDVTIPVFDDNILVNKDTSATNVHASVSVIPAIPTSAPAWLERDTTEVETPAWMSDGFTNRGDGRTAKGSPTRPGAHGGERLFQSYFKHQKREQEDDDEEESYEDEMVSDAGQMSGKGTTTRFSFFPQLGDIYLSKSQKDANSMNRSRDGISGKKESSTSSLTLGSILMRSLSQSSLFASRPQTNKQASTSNNEKKESSNDIESVAAGDQQSDTLPPQSHHHHHPSRLPFLSIITDSGSVATTHNNQAKRRVSFNDPDRVSFSLESSYPSVFSSSSPNGRDGSSFLRESPLPRRTYRCESMEDDGKNYVLRLSPMRTAVASMNGSGTPHSRESSDAAVVGPSGLNSLRSSRSSSHPAGHLSRHGSAASLTSISSQNRIVTAPEMLFGTSASSPSSPPASPPGRHVSRMISLDTLPILPADRSLQSRRNSTSSQASVAASGQYSAPNSLRSTPTNPLPLSMTRSSIISLQSADDDYLDSVDVTLRARDPQMVQQQSTSVGSRSSLGLFSDRGGSSITRESLMSAAAYSDISPPTSPRVQSDLLSLNVIQTLEEEDDDGIL